MGWECPGGSWPIAKASRTHPQRKDQVQAKGRDLRVGVGPQGDSVGRPQAMGLELIS